MTLRPASCNLNAGQAKVLGVSRKGLTFSFEEPGLDEGDRGWLRLHANQEPEAFITLPTLWIARVPLQYGAEAIRRFGDRILRATEVAIEAKAGQATWWRAHSDGVLTYLAEVLGRQLPHPDHGTVDAARSYWKLAPERGGRLWDDWRTGGYASIGWSGLGDVRKYPDQAAFDAARSQLDDEVYSKSGAGQVWRFAQIQPGDVVLANRGTTEVLGIGDVVSGYHFDPRDPDYPHRIGVRWRQLDPIQVVQPGWRRTLIELGKSDYEEIVGRNVAAHGDAAGRADVTADAEGGHFERVVDHLDTKQLAFSEECVADFLLALQTKRFVILSGVSGTGKSQLAIATAEALEGTIVRKVVDVEPERGVALEVLPYMRKFSRFILPTAFVETLDLPRREEGGLDVQVEVQGRRETMRLSRPKNREVTALLLKGRIRQWFLETFDEGDVFLVEVDEGGDELLVRLSAPATDVQAKKVENLAVVAVHPDWTDNRGLLGYWNPLTGQYVTTPFLELLLRAAADCAQAAIQRRAPHPFFVVLDEMNLARVEHYFADFLSALESGQPLHLHASPQAEAGETSSGALVPRDLKVPRNVFFVGTVNVDESTYMFSPKVLDRAFTLEFNEVDLGLDAGERQESLLRLETMPASLVPETGPHPRDWERFREQHKGLARIVMDIHAVLESEHRHFGYRVANEIARFVLLAVDQAGPEAADIALDLALLHKVLPKLHGSQHEIEDLLDRLFAFAVLGERPADADVQRLRVDEGLLIERGLLVRRAAEAEEDQPRLPRVAAKLWRMRRRLLRSGFTSFIE